MSGFSQARPTPNILPFASCLPCHIIFIAHSSPKGPLNHQRFAYQTERSLVVTGFSRHCLYCKPTWPHYLLMHPKSLLFKSPFSSSSHNHQVNKLTLTSICTTWWMEFMFMFSLYIYASHCVEVQLVFIKILNTVKEEVMIPCLIYNV